MTPEKELEFLRLLWPEYECREGRLIPKLHPTRETLVRLYEWMDDYGSSEYARGQAEMRERCPAPA